MLDEDCLPVDSSHTAAAAARTLRPRSHSREPVLSVTSTSPKTHRYQHVFFLGVRALCNQIELIRWDYK